MGSILLMNEKGMAEEVSVGEFAELKNEVKHLVGDVSEIKNSTKVISEAVQSTSESLAVLTVYVEQNKSIGERIEKVESKVDGINLKIAAVTGVATAIGWLVVNADKIKGLFG